MKRPGPPSIADIVFMLAAPVFAIAGAVRLTQSDGDLAGHIRMGDSILQTHQLPAHSLASYTAAAEPLIAPGWLSEVLFASLYQSGGLPLITAVTGIVIGLTHALIAQFLRRRGVDPRFALIAALGSLILGAAHWLARPHMFSILAAALTLFLLESKPRYRELLFLPLFALWANLHGGWLFGLLLIFAYIIGDICEAALSRNTRADFLGAARRNTIALAIASAATLLTPYGFALHKEVVGAVTSVSLADNIDEYMSPNFHEAANLPFLIAILLVVISAGSLRKRVPLTWLTAITMGLFFGLRATRNIALFGVTAIPLLALHVHAAWPAARKSFPWFAAIPSMDARARAGLWSVPVAALLLLLGINRGHAGGLSLIADGYDARAFPVDAVRAARSANLQGRIFLPWTWGGYFLQAWPGSSIHVDPLKFSQTTIDSHTRIEATYPGWQDEMTRWKIELAVIEPDSRLAKALEREPGWAPFYRDSTAVVFRHMPYGVPATGTAR